MYRLLLKPIFFSLDPEKAHHFTFNLIRWMHRIPGFGAISRAMYRPADTDSIDLWGLHFPNRIGMAAGFDKDGKLYRELYNYGFGFIEVGTVTPKAQPGNPKPRLFRLPADEALINRMGFNNGGVEELAERLKAKRPKDLIIGGNIGKNKLTPNENALDDYRICRKALHPYVDYFVVNVSSPNTPNLRDLQEKEPLKRILKALKEDNAAEENPKPILLKIAPDLSDAQLDDIIEIVEETQIEGLIATNTTISREGLKTPTSIVEAIGAGGLSGKPVKARSTEVIRYLKKNSKTDFPIIAVGGVQTKADYLEKLEAGASLVQVYTGFIYEGPGLVKKLLA
ncbi:quinone-dependent dihydroorotate dehydrogenase [Croceimicrobium hydrocarbonivorans]|uniref:Dihydroorotate dehydrogenase (quinone) n=1 Tax=Croceimicrobium hydrocarbonivorans TaxID=2761580 RepID=A0A7H0VF84_9FLAO|nr:quinone-dependent dihydroorotate dehydrogenase [Croceimicrobium hydrocarbonivorans]QNR24382.1 quinone-dependent dihydroorotate dehydrogenase [Croceimicrobium hydrocarbonivorans]